MLYETIAYAVDDRVALITFDRAERLNAFTPELCAEVVAALEAAAGDAEVRVIVIEGAGGRAFSSGYDLSATAGRRLETASDWRAFLEEFEPFAWSPWDCAKPVFAMIDGYCLGGGFELALMCDVRYASATSRFGAVEARFSAGVSTLILPWIIGASARELIYSGDIIDAAAALRLGVVNKVFAADALRAETMKAAKRMARVATATLKWNKRALNGTFEAMGLREAMRAGLEACVANNVARSPETDTFRRLVKEEGMEAALKWRKGMFAPYE